MSKIIHFLGWDKPVAATAAQFILKNARPPLVKLDHTLIVAPTREAGRGLREKMTVLCRQKKTALLGARIVTPLFFIQAQGNDEKAAAKPIVQSAFIKTLLSLRGDDCPTLFPRGIPQNNHQWAFAAANLIQGLRDDLSDAGASINSVLEKHSSELQELPRWQDLGRIEKLYLENLDKAGLQDPCLLKLAGSRAPVVPPEISQIIIASVPDPSLLALTALGELSKKVEVEILVMAPVELRDHFDDWGRPRPDKWRDRLIDIPAPEKNIMIAGQPGAQAQAAGDLIQAGEHHLADVCVGVPDRAVIPYLQDKLESAGITAFDPADRPVKDHHLYHLVKAWRQLTDNSSFANAAAFLRMVNILNYLQAARGVCASGLLSELDLLQNRALPQTLRDMELALKKTKDFPYLTAAVKYLNEVLTTAKKEAPHEALRDLLQQVFAFKTITGHSDADNDFKAVAVLVSEVLNEITYAWPYLKELPSRLINQLILNSLDDLSIPRHREGAKVELLGWLELAWNDAPLMIITGFNEGQVPDTRQSDIFLPDALKKGLGLRNNETRFARDAYLLSLILASRGQSGRVVLMAGKTSPAGDPLKPSRLLFRCPDSQLAERAELVFREVKDETHKPSFSITFKLDPAAPLAGRPPPLLPSELYATQFRDYLACPFRFYLKHILKMERAGFKVELDAVDFGKMIHAVLEKFSGNHGINNAADPRAIQKHLHGLLDDYLRGVYGMNDSFPILYAREIAGARLKAFAEHQAGLASAGWQTVERELKCQLTIGGVRITGKIDRIDINRHSGKLRIIDYKTSDSAENPSQAHIKKSRKAIPDYARVRDAGNEQWLDLQMPLYWHMFKGTDLAKKNGEIELCYFNLPKAVSNSRIESWTDFDKTLADSACQSAEKIIARIKRGIFWPPSDSVQYDDFEGLFNEDMHGYFEGEKITEFFATKKHKGTQSMK